MKALPLTRRNTDSWSYVDVGARRRGLKPIVMGRSSVHSRTDGGQEHGMRWLWQNSVRPRREEYKPRPPGGSGGGGVGVSVVT